MHLTNHESPQIRLAPVVQEPRCGGAHARARHRSEHGDLHNHQHGPAPFAPGEKSRGGDIFHGALLLDLDDPSCIRAKSGEILVPESDYEREGFVPNVVFPSGVVVRGESLLIYYGVADESCAVVEWRLPDLLNRLLDATRHGTP